MNITHPMTEGDKLYIMRVENLYDMVHTKLEYVCGVYTQYSN